MGRTSQTTKVGFQIPKVTLQSGSISSAIAMSFVVARRMAVPLVAKTFQRRTAVLVPKPGEAAAMEAEAIAQIRARVAHQKQLSKLKDHPIEEETAEMFRWVNVTFAVGIPVCILSAFYSFFFDVHPHRHEGELPEYMKIRSKEFPWECSDCDLFDGKCWKQCRAEKNA